MKNSTKDKAERRFHEVKRMVKEVAGCSSCLREVN